jgi:ABC-type spermidine/putrescine transport system permease subunit II
MKKFWAEFILTFLILPWFLWVTMSIFESQKVDAVQKSEYRTIIEKLEDLKLEIRRIKK